ncbi:Outer membrane efflux protein [Stieleria bergensis]|uniref:Outer membrane efflux protein n=1 Tax=Stieleria bergensis TaxID=2528025 RepID=A0A517ST53_9BACT|nr:Outer membrane efflux protein [Planctomycetes bacterium SV_7m_r]
MSRKILKGTIAGTVLSLSIWGSPASISFAQETEVKSETTASGNLRKHAELRSMLQSVDAFAQQILPRLVAEARTREWESNLILGIFEHRVKHSISSHSRSDEYAIVSKAVDEFSRQLRADVERIPTESARRVALVAPDGLLLNSVKDTLVDQIIGRMSELDGKSSNSESDRPKDALGWARVKVSIAKDTKSEEKSSYSALDWRQPVSFGSANGKGRGALSVASEERPVDKPGAIGLASHAFGDEAAGPKLRPAATISDDRDSSTFQLLKPLTNDGQLGEVQSSLAKGILDVTQPVVAGENSSSAGNVSASVAGMTTATSTLSTAEALPTPVGTPEVVHHIASPAPVVIEHGTVSPFVQQYTQPHTCGPQCSHNTRFQTRSRLCDNIFHPPECYPVIDGNSLLGEYQARASTYPDDSETTVFVEQKRLPSDYRAWWHDAVTQSFQGEGAASIPVDVESLVLFSMQFAPQIAALQVDPAIHETRIVQEDAEFDWIAFVEGTYDHLDEPWIYNNALVIGGVPGIVYNPDRLKSDEFNVQGGMRKMSRKGGEVELYQEFDSLSNNQPFLDPNPANTARFEINVKKPLLRGNGLAVNQSRVVIARLNRDIGENDTVVSIEDHICDVHEAYWILYRERASLLQKLKALEKGGDIMKVIQARQDVDATQGQLMRTRSVVAKRQSEIPRLRAAVRNSQAQLRLLVNSPDLKNNLSAELLPFDLPNNDPLSVSMQGSFQTALTKRQDIAAAIKQIHRTSIQLEVSKNDLLPRFDLDLYMYTAGIQRVRSSFADQFSNGPGVGAGLVYELPVGNRKARAAKEQKELLLTKAFKEFEVVVETGLVETEQAVNDVNSAYVEMLACYNSMIQATRETEYAETRWRNVASDGASLQFLDALFDSQDRMAEEESNFVASQVRYELAIIELKRALGILLCEPSKNAHGIPAK